MIPRAPGGVDWWRVIVDLCRAGHTHESIATSIRVGKSTIAGWKEGSEPRHKDGEVLIEMWVEVTGNSRETVHRLR
jgi:hypothetical protein